MKKLLAAILAGVAGFALFKKLNDGKNDQELWTQADTE